MAASRLVLVVLFAVVVVCRHHAKPAAKHHISRAKILEEAGLVPEGATIDRERGLGYCSALNEPAGYDFEFLPKGSGPEQRTSPIAPARAEDVCGCMCASDDMSQGDCFECPEGEKAFVNGQWKCIECAADTKLDTSTGSAVCADVKAVRGESVKAALSCPAAYPRKSVVGGCLLCEADCPPIPESSTEFVYTMNPCKCSTRVCCGLSKPEEPEVTADGVTCVALGPIQGPKDENVHVKTLECPKGFERVTFSRNGKEVVQCAKAEPCVYPLELPPSLPVTAVMCGPLTAKYLEISMKAALKAVALYKPPRGGPAKVPYECIMRCVNTYSKMTECSQLTKEFYEKNQAAGTKDVSTLVKSCMNDQGKGSHAVYTSWPNTFVEKRSADAKYAEFTPLARSVNHASFCAKHTPSPLNAVTLLNKAILDVSKTSKYMERSLKSVASYASKIFGAMSCRSTCEGTFKPDSSATVEECLQHCTGISAS